MPEYLAPGVFVEEVSFRAKAIEGVSTSVAGMVGPTRSGPLRGKPEVVTSIAEFTRIYGDAEDLEFEGSAVSNHTAIAAQAFFANGGKQLYVARIDNGTGTAAEPAEVRDANNHVIFNSRFPGAMGNYTLELRWRDSENLLQFETTSAPDEDELIFLHATGLTSAVRATGIASRVPASSFPLEIHALVRRNGNQYVIDDNRCVLTPNEGTLEGTDLRPDEADEGDEGVLMAAGLVSSADTTVQFSRVRAKQPTSGALADGTSAVLTLAEVTDLSAYTGADWGTLTTLRGTLDADGSTFTVAAGDLNPGVAADIVLPLMALAASADSVRAVMVQRNFDIDVYVGEPEGTADYTYGNISTAPGADNSLSDVLLATPEQRYDRMTSPVSCTVADGVTGDQVVAALYDMFDAAALHPLPASIEGPRYLITLDGGSDGGAPGAIDYRGVTDEVNGSTGLAALEDIEDISIAMAPAAAAHANSHQAVVAELQRHCRKMRYRIGIVDARRGMSLSEVRDFRSNFDDSRLALYYPWVVIKDPNGSGQDIEVPPAGFVAGIYAGTDVRRGVHKPPANEPVIGALRFAQDINRFQQELLNPNGINCLRSFPGRGHRVWGGRTLSSDPEWIYVNVRRYFLYLERSIEKSTQWVVFEPNGERLWSNVRSSVEDFLYNEWRNGRLLGDSPKAAYFVRCDRSTMTQNDLDFGRLVCLVGVAPLRPAEFVIFRIGQKTADA